MERSFIMSILKTVELKKYYGSSENDNPVVAPDKHTLAFLYMEGQFCLL